MRDLIPPKAKIVPTPLEHHGDVRVDNYYWLRDRNDPDVLRYLEAENAYTEAAMKDAKALEDALYNEMLGHVQQDDSDAPFPREKFLYYKRMETGKSYALHCRKSSAEAEEQIILDENELAAGREYFSLGNFAIDTTERLLAYSTDTEGDEVYVTRFRDLAAGSDLSDSIPETYYSLAWNNDSSAIYYVTLDPAKRPYRIWRHRLGFPEDELIYEETDQRFEVDVYKSRDHRYIFIHSESKVSTEIRFARADEPPPEFRVIWPRRQDVLYDVESRYDELYILTNDGAKEFRLVLCPAYNPDPATAREIVPERPGITLESVKAFESFLAIFERDQGLPRIRIHDVATGAGHYIDFDEPAFTLASSHNEVFATNVLRFAYTSLVTPYSVFEYNVHSRERALLKQTPVPAYDSGAYTSERLFATARDGVRVPISLVYRKGFVADGSAPLLLYGYGSYGIRSDPAFRSERLPLLDRGFAFAIAHIRGGGDLGRLWYEDGKLLKKRNTFNDFIDCANHLVETRYTSRAKLVIQGGSAGGMLMGAVMNQEPALCHTVVAMVPFVDTLTTCLDPTLPLTIGEYEEWGNPGDPEYYKYIKTYSPIDNVKPAYYPHILVTAGLNDPRVSYWEPAKWTAKLRAEKRGQNLLLLKTNMGAGHFGVSGRYARLKELAFIYAFMLKSLEIPSTHEN
jgi:oligopeptidase B